LQEFAYIASHDLKEPLRTIASHTQLLARRYKGKLDGDADELIQFVVNATLRMSELLGGLLDYSRAARSQNSPFQPVELSGSLDWAMMNLQAAIQESGATITHGPLPVVNGDATQLAQIFQHLLDNGIKYRSREPARIHVSAEREPSHWVLSFQDNGIGIEPVYHDKIFGIFKRLHGREYPGIGVGLAICRRIAERHGGKAWVNSELGKGSEFRVSIGVD
jgi:light-regulated signal transduction histidine kinase (bacteriophytochrome)